MPTNADLIAQIKQVINPEILLLGVLKEELICQEKALEQARATLLQQESPVANLSHVYKTASAPERERCTEGRKGRKKEQKRKTGRL